MARWQRYLSLLGLAIALVIVTPAVVRADNCSSLGDCWSGSASAAATSAAAAGALAAVASGLLSGRRNEDGHPARNGRPGGGSSSGHGSATGASGPGAPAEQAATPPDDPPDRPPDLLLGDGLPGLWTQDDLPGTLQVERDGTSYRARRGQPWACLPSGPAPSNGGDTSVYPTSDQHFAATRDGDRLVGEMAICWFGNGDAPDWAPASLELSLDADGQRLVGTWQDDEKGQGEAVTLTRVPDPLLTPEDFGLPATNLRTYGYGVKKAHRKDGTIVTVPEDYAFDAEADDEVVRHRGLDFSSRNDAWVVESLPFATPVAGTVHRYANSPWNTIGLRLATGDWLQFLHAREIHVQDGAWVDAGTILGATGATGATTIHLHVQGRTFAGDSANPDAIVARARPTGANA